MTQAFLIVVRILATALFLYWGVRLWRSTNSLTSRMLGAVFSAALIWQATVGTWA
jgi:hypothetical protein